MTRKARKAQEDTAVEPTPQGEPEPEQTGEEVQAPVLRALTYVGRLDIFKWNEEVIFTPGLTQEVSDDVFKAITSSYFSTEFISE
jgi:hypothetical protein